MSATTLYVSDNAVCQRQLCMSATSLNVREHPIELLLEVVMLLLLCLKDVVEDVNLGLEVEVAPPHQLQLLRLSLYPPIGRRNNTVRDA
jgi:hypothetical protein